MWRAIRGARAMLGHLGDLLRFSLDSENLREVTMAQEIEALDHYLAIQSARFGDRLRTHVEIPAELRDARLPALVLQPLVENAIRHGLAEQPGVGELRVSARRDGEWLTLAVQDNGIGLEEGWSLERDAGIGLSNTRSRLAETYGERQSFCVKAAEGGGVVAEVRVPFDAPASVRGNGATARSRAHAIPKG